MKRDFNLIREILIFVESSEHGNVHRSIVIDGYTDEQIGYHVHLMGQAGLADTSNVSSLDGNSPKAILHSITWQGHEFLDAMRDDTIWNKAKETILKQAPGIALNSLSAWLKHEAAMRFGIPLN